MIMTKPGSDSPQHTECRRTVLPQNDYDQAWIGLSDDIPYSPGKMDFRWIDQSPVDYFNWNAGEPADSDERCGRMYSAGMGGTIGGTWNNDLCTKTAAFVCQGPPNTPTPAPTTPPPTPDTTVTCLLGGRTFKYFDERKTWDQAMEACKEWESTAMLASIHSSAGE